VLSRLAEGDTEDLGGLNWSHLNLPTLAEEGDPLGRQEGAALWPERYDLKRLHGIRDTNPYDFASLYQQRPQVRGGTVFLDGVTTYNPEDRNTAAKLYITVDTSRALPTVTLPGLYRSCSRCPELPDTRSQEAPATPLIRESRGCLFSSGIRRLVESRQLERRSEDPAR
jgi:hypothetical protein